MECRLATVVALFENKNAKIKFDGEDKPREKEYSYLQNYSPQLNDRVVVIPTGDSYIILGSLLYKTEPPESPQTNLERITTTMNKWDSDIKGKLTSLSDKFDKLEVETVDSLKKQTFSINSIQSSIDSAKKIAEEAKGSAEAAKNSASSIQNSISQLQSSLNTVSNTANAAKSTANSAQSTANSAQSTANSAKNKADSLGYRIDSLTYKVNRIGAKVGVY